MGKGEEATDRSYPSLQEGISNLEGGNNTNDGFWTASIKRENDNKRKAGEPYHYFRDNPYSAESSAGSNLQPINSIEKALENMRSDNGCHPLFFDGDTENNLEPNYSPWEEAEELDVQVMETGKFKPGANDPDTLTRMDNLASTYRDHDEEEDGEEWDDEEGEDGVVRWQRNYGDEDVRHPGLTRQYLQLKETADRVVENACCMRRIWAHKISFFVLHPRDVAHLGSGPAQDWLSLVHPQKHFWKATPQRPQLLQL